MSSPDSKDPLPPKPPDFVRSLKWWWIYGVNQWRWTVPACILAIILASYKLGHIETASTYLFSDVSACKNPNEMEKPLHCNTSGDKK